MKNNYVKYKRIKKTFNVNKKTDEYIQEFFDDLVKDGFDIIYYNEIINQLDIHLTILVGRKNHKI